MLVTTEEFHQAQSKNYERAHMCVGVLAPAVEKTVIV